MIQLNRRLILTVFSALQCPTSLSHKFHIIFCKITFFRIMIITCQALHMQLKNAAFFRAASFFNLRSHHQSGDRKIPIERSRALPQSDTTYLSAPLALLSSLSLKEILFLTFFTRINPNRAECSLTR